MTVNPDIREKPNEGMENEAPNVSTPVEDVVLSKLNEFKVIRNRQFKWIVIYLPFFLIFILLIDWLIGPQIFARDLFRLSGIVGAIIELFIFNNLFTKVPKTFSNIWVRGTVGSPLKGSNFTAFLQEFEATLNHKFVFLVGIAFSCITIASTYPVRYWFATGLSPYSDVSKLFYLASGGVILFEIFIAYIIGLMVWRFGVIAFYIGKLGREFKLKILLKHPDRSGGLRPLGDLCLTNAFLIIVPVIILSIWIIVAGKPGYDVYQLWSNLFRNLLVILTIVSIFVFFQPLYQIHNQMMIYGQNIRLELESLSRKIDEIGSELRAQADTLPPEEGNKQLEKVEFLRKVYESDRKIPTWPFDINIALKFSTAQAIPIWGKRELRNVNSQLG